MTTEKKAGIAGGITLLALLAAIGTGWGHIEPAMTWAVKNLGVILAREQVQALLASSAIGVLVGTWLPHLLPHSWPPARTRMVTGLAGAALTLAAALVLVPTRIGFVYACLAASATPTVSQALAGLIYWLKPCAKPASLKP